MKHFNLRRAFTQGASSLVYLLTKVFCSFLKKRLLPKVLSTIIISEQISKVSKSSHHIFHVICKRCIKITWNKCIQPGDSEWSCTNVEQEKISDITITLLPRISVVRYCDTVSCITPSSSSAACLTSRALTAVPIRITYKSQSNSLTDLRQRKPHRRAPAETLYKTHTHLHVCMIKNNSKRTGGRY